MIVPLIGSTSGTSRGTGVTGTGASGTTTGTVELLNSLPYCAVAAVICAYPKASLRNSQGQPGGVDDFKAFGMLVPRELKTHIGGNNSSSSSSSSNNGSFNLLGSIWSSSLFPEGRAPDDHIVLVNFIGGSHNPQLVKGEEKGTFGEHSLSRASTSPSSPPSDDELVDIVHRELGEILLHPGTGTGTGSGMDKPIVLAVKRWEKGIPQFVK